MGFGCKSKSEPENRNRKLTYLGAVLVLSMLQARKIAKTREEEKVPLHRKNGTGRDL